MIMSDGKFIWRHVFSYVSFAMTCAVGAQTAEVVIDFEKAIGPVKPVNGVGQPPMIGALGSWSMMHYLKEASIPYSRLHDVGGWLGGGLYVDIPNLFPDFDADENDQDSYRFAYTDSLLNALVANGVEPYFRLGVTIENFAGNGYPPLRIYPPKDFAKWARICEHVIRHYTEGWANGYRHSISHWEVWNEPDNMPTISEQPMWRAPFSEYVRLYGVTAKHLKGKFPHLKIGGYGSSGFYGVGSSWGKNDPARVNHFMDCFTNFLYQARAENMPLDFFSFHFYDKPAFLVRQMDYCRRTLDAYGFKDTEMSLNEWHTGGGGDVLGTSSQAAEIASVLLLLQNGPVSDAEIYDARCDVGSYSPLFNPLTYKPHKAYYAFAAFNELRKRGTAVAVQVSGNNRLHVVAAGGELDSAIMMANDSDEPAPFVCNLHGRTVMSCRITDSNRTDAVISFPAELPPRSFLVAILSPKK